MTDTDIGPPAQDGAKLGLWLSACVCVPVGVCGGCSEDGNARKPPDEGYIPRTYSSAR